MRYHDILRSQDLWYPLVLHAEYPVHCTTSLYATILHLQALWPYMALGSILYSTVLRTTAPICHLACQGGSCPRPLGSVRYRRHCMLQDYVCRDIAQYSPLDCTYAVYCLQYYAVPLRTCPDTSPAISSDLRICLRSVDL